MSIDRRAVVARHRVVHRSPDALSPLTVGNGNFAFTADVTGLQTFAGFHDLDLNRAQGRTAMPLGTQAQWGFHESPNPNTWDLEHVMLPYESARGTVEYPVLFDLDTEPDDLDVVGRAGDFLWVNPHRIDLGRLGFIFTDPDDGRTIDDIHELTAVEQSLDLWTGMLDSRFRVAGEQVVVTTAAHPDADALAVRISSPLLSTGAAQLHLSFAYGADSFTRSMDWESPSKHRSEPRSTPHGLSIERTMDATRYLVDIRLDADTSWRQTSPHGFQFTTSADTLDIVVRFADAQNIPGDEVPDTAATFAATTTHWESFWRSGAAIDLAGSTHPGAFELERRVVLSQYLTAIQCAGDLPSQETGLVMNSWAGKFHLEMHWWHAAHFAMWGRPELLERSFRWYLRALPVAREIAARQGYAGARWPKHVGPDARESPNDIGPLLIWQQPHPIHLAELLRLSSPDPERILRDYSEIVEASAEFLADFMHADADGSVHLGPPVMPAQERYDPAAVQDPVFEVAYAAWGIETAQQWRTRTGRERRADWDAVTAALAMPEIVEGVYPAVRGLATVRTDHPSMLGALSVSPPTPLIDPVAMSATLDDVMADWSWQTAWGWDFPMMAMCATRLGRPDAAVESLLMAAAKNTYLVNGHNFQVPYELPLYLPGNGGLLAAVAMMAAGTSGREAAPGFPADSWVVAAEGFAPRP